MKCIVAGAGQWGKNLIRNANDLGILGGVFDTSSTRRTEIEQTYPDVRTFATYEEALDAKAEAVIVATPAETHASMAMQALRSGKHVFVEKPLALQRIDAQALVETADAFQRTLFVGHVLLYHPAVIEMLRQIRLGTIGNVRHVRTRRLGLGRIRTVEDVWWSFAPHDIAVLLEIYGELPSAGIAGYSSHISPNIADFVDATFTFGPERSAHVEVSWLDPARTQCIDVFGSNGVLRYTDDRTEGSTLTLTECGAIVAPVPDTWRRDPVRLPFASGEPLRRELEQFIRSVETGEPAPTDGREGMRVVTVLSMVAPGRAEDVRMEPSL